MKLCKSKTERRAELEAMTHEERLSLARRLNAAGMGLMVSAFGCFAGVTGGLWGSIGPGAVGAGIGASSGLLCASFFGPFRSSGQVRRWDREIEAGGGGEGGRGDEENGC